MAMSARPPLPSATMRRDELTTAASWDRLWRAPQARAAGARSRLRTQEPWLRLLGHLLDASPPGSHVLELGCAPGAMIEQLHALRPDRVYRGIDIAEEGLAAARARLGAQGIDAELTLGDIRDADVEPADLVISFGLAEHFTDPTEAVRHHVRFVKPGGRVAVTVPNYAHPVVVRAMRWFTPETLATHNLDIMSRPALTAAMTGAGLVDVVTGESGGPTLPNSRPRPGVAGTAYKLAARGWNLTTSTVLPERTLWSSSVWGLGTA